MTQLNDQNIIWQEKFERSPDDFYQLDEICLPTEWPNLAFLKAIKNGDAYLAKFNKSQQREIDRAREYLKHFTQLKIPQVSVFTFKHSSILANGFGDYSETAFSCAGQKEIRTTILVNPTYLKLADSYQLASTITHEIHHAAHALKADVSSSVYVEESLTRSFEELSVGFCEMCISQALYQEALISRNSLEELIEEESQNEEAREGLSWISAALDLTPSLELDEACQFLSQMSIVALREGRDSRTLALLNGFSNKSLSKEEWEEMISY